jgi:regulation of enolase protein 1 (concanavalin A-like superfamily)
MTDTLTLTAIPHPLHWDAPAAHAAVDADGALALTAGPRSDHFIDPRGAAAIGNAPRLLFTPDATFLLSAHAHGALEATYDAAVLMLYVNGRSWAKLCLELSPQGEPMIVSVVTNGLSDDCNSVVLASADAWLRVAGLGNAFAFHYSLDGQTWHFVRHFTLHERADVRAGFSVQSPTGAGCTVIYSEIRYQPVALEDLRSGA